jgi:cytochrome c556
MRHDDHPSRRHPMRSIVICALGLAALGVGAELYAQASSDFNPKITVVEIMDAMVMPSAQIVWDAVSYDVTEKGEKITGPKTDEDWQKVRWAAVTLAESANNLMVPGRAVNHPGVKPGEGELAPAEIQKLIVANRGAWVAHAKVLYAAVTEAINAVDAKDTDKVSDAGGTIDAACESCHLQFWYPDQNKKK